MCQSDVMFIDKVKLLIKVIASSHFLKQCFTCKMAHESLADKVRNI